MKGTLYTIWIGETKKGQTWKDVYTYTRNNSNSYFDPTAKDVRREEFFDSLSDLLLDLLISKELI
jgi:hypothetical protein